MNPSLKVAMKCPQIKKRGAQSVVPLGFFLVRLPTASQSLPHTNPCKQIDGRKSLVNL